MPPQQNPDLMGAQGIFSLPRFQDILQPRLGGEMCGDEVMKLEFSDLSGNDRWGGEPG